MFHTDAPPQPAVQNQLGEAIVRHRRWIYFAIALVFIASFNGRWRVGLDSAVYRGLGEAIAAGKGYDFGEFGSTQVYPGLPLVIAASQLISGPTDPHWPILPLLFMIGCAVLSLVITYRMILLHYPRWVAVTVTGLLGLNAVFIKHANEILTDMPFFLGMLMALYGWELLRQSLTTRERANALAMLLPGLIIAASMRPTFWILAAGCVIVCVWGLVTNGRRVAYAVTLAIVLAVSLGFVLLDPRTEGVSLTSGGYEREAMAIVRDVRGLPGRIYDEGKIVLKEHLQEAFFGARLPRVTGIIFAAMLLAGSVLVMRRQLLWGLLVPLIVAATMVLSSQPRYYLMVLPFLLLGWILLLGQLTRRLRPDHAQLAIACGLGLVLVMNISKIIPFIIEQHSRPFLEHYRGGRTVHALQMAEIIREHVKPGEVVISPQGSLVRYMSGREVLTEREVLSGTRSPVHWPDHLRRMKLDYAVFPARVYDKEPDLMRLFNQKVLVPAQPIASIDVPKQGEMYLAPVAVTDREGDWRHWDTSEIAARRLRQQQLSPRQQRLLEQRQLATTRPWLADLSIDSESMWRVAADGWLDPSDPQPLPPGTVAKKPALSPRQQRAREQRQLATTRPWLADVSIDSPAMWRAAADNWLEASQPQPVPPGTIAKTPLSPRQQRAREQRELATTRPWLADVSIDSPSIWRAAADGWLDPNDPMPLPVDDKPLSPRQQRLREQRQLATTRPWLMDVPVDSPAKWRAAADGWFDPDEPPPPAP